MKILQFIFLMLPLCSMYAQDYELGKVTIAELEQKSYPADAGAPAAILFEKGVSCMMYSESKGFYLVTDVEVKIKIVMVKNIIQIQLNLFLELEI